MKKNSVITFCFFLACSFTNTTFAVDIGEPAPTCNTKSSENNQSLSSIPHKSKPVLIDFGATWCPPCLKSTPFFNQLSQEFPTEKLEMMAINVDESTRTAQQFLETHPVTYNIAFDPTGECPKTFGVKAMPSKYLVDKTGNIGHVQLGFHEGDIADLSSRVKTLIEE